MSNEEFPREDRNYHLARAIMYLDAAMHELSEAIKFSNEKQVLVMSDIAKELNQATADIVAQIKK